MDGNLLEKYNFICKTFKLQPETSVDPSFYRPLSGEEKATVHPMTLAFEWDEHPENASLEYRKKFLGQSTEKPTKSATEVLEEAGFYRTTIDDVQRTQRPISGTAKAYVGEFEGIGSPWIWIMGRAGVGKTLTAAWVAAQGYLRVGIAPTYIAAQEMTERVNSCGNYRGSDGHATKYEVRRKWQDAEWLVIDGLGMERCNNPSFETLSKVIENRAARKLPTILISRYSPMEWLIRYQNRGLDGQEISRQRRMLVNALGGWKRDKEAAKEAVRMHVCIITEEDNRQKIA